MNLDSLLMAVLLNATCSGLIIARHCHGATGASHVCSMERAMLGQQEQ